MDWKLELDALIETTTAFTNQVKRKPVPDLPIAMKIAEQALAETPKPVAPNANITSIALLTSERDQILQRVSNFKAHQEKMAREREHHYLQVKARMMAPTAFLDDRKKTPPA
jgi:hypothetical protein